jgi:DNA-binding NarL/FixJ family response regulator
MNDAIIPTIILMTNLTQREREVLTLLSEGQLDKEIAVKLDISIYTVHEHVRNIFEKLRVRNRTEAVVKFLHNRRAGGMRH